MQRFSLRSRRAFVFISHVLIVVFCSSVPYTNHINVVTWTCNCIDLQSCRGMNENKNVVSFGVPCMTEFGLKVGNRSVKCLISVIIALVNPIFLMLPVWFPSVSFRSATNCNFPSRWIVPSWEWLRKASCGFDECYSYGPAAMQESSVDAQDNQAALSNRLNDHQILSL